MVNKNQFVLKSKFYIVPFINIRFRKNVISIVGDFDGIFQHVSLAWYVKL